MQNAEEMWERFEPPPALRKPILPLHSLAPNPKITNIVDGADARYSTDSSDHLMFTCENEMRLKLLRTALDNYIKRYIHCQAES